jgi:hypothetical protein
MSDIEELIEGLLLVVNLHSDRLLLDQELGVQVDQEWRHVLHLPLFLIDAGSIVEINQHLLQFLIFWHCSSAWNWEVEH